MDITSEHEISYTIQHQGAFLNYVEDEYCATHQRVLVNHHDSVPSSNLVPSTSGSGSVQSCFVPYDFSSDVEESSSPHNVAETKPRRSNHAAPILTTARLYFISTPGAPKNWGQINPNINDHHSNSMEISSTFWIQDITDWWHQQDETHSKYADFANVGRKIFSIIPHGVGVEANISLGWDHSAWRQIKTTGKTCLKDVVVTQVARANTSILVGDDPALHLTNTAHDLKMMNDADERTLHRMAKVHNFVEMWQGSQNLRATQKESRDQHN